MQQHDFGDLTQQWSIRNFDPLAGPALIAVSGGRDSMLLLHLWLKVFAPKLNHGVAMVDHRLRAESAREASWLQQQLEIIVCEKQSIHPVIPFHFKRLEPNSKPNRMSVEDWGRRERYQFFKQVQNEYGYKYILTAHHLQDLVETFWLSIYRGTGLKGLRGLRFARTDGVYRPLLYCPKDQLDTWVADFKIDWVEDKSNTDTRFLRNWVRHRYLNNPDVVSDPTAKQTILSICRLAEECYAKSEKMWDSEWDYSNPQKIAFVGEGFPVFESLAWMLEQLDSFLTEARYRECERQLSHSGRFDCSLDGNRRIYRTKAKFFIVFR